LGFFTALRFLTILPSPFGRGASPHAYGESLPYFPLVGLVLGLILSGLYLLLQLVMPPPLVAGLLVIALLLLSGAHHLDGLIDTADGLGGGAARLEAAKTSIAGGRGATAAALLLLLKFAALSSLGCWPALLIAPVVGRWLMVSTLHIFPAARRSGFGAEFKRGANRRRFLIATAITVIATLLVMGLWPGLIILSSAWVLSTGLGWYLSRRLGGISGDGYGAVGEVAETLALVTAVSIC